MLTTVIVCCEVGPREASASENYSKDLSYPARVQTDYYDGMEFRVYTSRYGESGVHVINITKEKLEIELLQKQLDEINKRDTL